MSEAQQLSWAVLGQSTKPGTARRGPGGWAQVEKSDWRPTPGAWGLVLPARLGRQAAITTNSCTHFMLVVQP